MLLRPTRVRAKPARSHISAHGYAKNAPHFTLPNKDTPKTRPVLGPNLRRKTFGGVCFCAPTRVRAKFGGFHISAHGYTQNAPHFTLPNKDTPKSCPILDPNPCRRIFGGVCFCAPTRVHAKFVQFHISAYGYTKNAPDFSRKSLSQDISGRMQYAPTWVRAKFGGFHIPTHDIARNPAGFGLCHTT